MVQFADKPGYGDAGSDSRTAHPGEPPEEHLARAKAEEYYCNRARDIYEPYLSAPRLYETTEEGEKVYLTEEQI